jgi:phosphatidylglycerol---prolipoprotein diacylglyceryl transferase
MLSYPQIDPVAIALGPVKVHWYGIMYLIGFASTWALGVYRAKKGYYSLLPNQVSDAIFYAAMGVILGGRIGYMLFYNLGTFLDSPLTIFKIWDGGMSFHGGLIGVIIATWIYAYKIKSNLFDILDFFSPMVPIGLGFGRIGNFINDELWGRVTNSSFSMIFPTGGPLPRYPSQLIEALLEGLALFLILWLLSLKPRQRYILSGNFALFYGIFRFISEFFRQPDPQMGYVLFGWMTQGQLLSIPLIIIGALMLLYVFLRQHKLYNPRAGQFIKEQYI